MKMSSLLNMIYKDNKNYMQEKKDSVEAENMMCHQMTSLKPYSVCLWGRFELEVE